jgi:tRNA-Thr(GGU) m(6)t(6)A37 methyltransferase TsaA
LYKPVNALLLSPETAMRDTYCLQPIGSIHQEPDDVRIDIDPTFKDGLLGLDSFSHIIVCYWFHENDTPAARSRLQVHPRKNPANPLTGVFATHAPVRPNLIALSRCRVLSIDACTIYIDTIDARHGSPVIDIKCYIPHPLAPSQIRLPDWVRQQPENGHEIRAEGR